MEEGETFECAFRSRHSVPPGSAQYAKQPNQPERERGNETKTNTKIPKEKDIKVNLQAPQGGWRRWKKVFPGVALLHHHHGSPQLGLARHHQRHHDLVGRLQQLPATAKLQQQLLKHISPTFTLSYSAQVLTRMAIFQQLLIRS